MTSTKRTSSKGTSTADRETAARERTEKLEALHASLAEQVETLTTSVGCAAMLDAARVFTPYSLNNTLLLHMQLSKRGMPIQRVAGFNTWRTLGRVVLKGERGLAVIAPCVLPAEGWQRRRRACDDAFGGFGRPEDARCIAWIQDFVCVCRAADLGRGGSRCSSSATEWPVAGRPVDRSERSCDGRGLQGRTRGLWQRRRLNRPSRAGRAYS